MRIFLLQLLQDFCDSILEKVVNLVIYDVLDFLAQASGKSTDFVVIWYYYDLTTKERDVAIC